ncbi:DUF3055 family protein [Neobacillus sp. PS3-12]|jgi:hypothetical protein|uniref:SAV0927 family protein n=1 Tax=Neobacillus sp. PS3-12 TaxID=3070677 RepID=UPI0027DFD7EB|nr:SAV0927 family protein [Neobacillus sp. PS3-12]WML52370.1 DUF3055 family protein [Neobacillus sp. PS3-12]
MKLDILSEQKEQQLLHYFCLISDHHRYDFTIGYSEYFFGKAMVTSLQSGQMVLLCQDDIDLEIHWADKLGIETEDISELQEFFRLVLQTRPFHEEYE